MLVLIISSDDVSFQILSYNSKVLHNCDIRCGNDFLLYDKIIISEITKPCDDNGFSFHKKANLPTNVGMNEC